MEIFNNINSVTKKYDTNLNNSHRNEKIDKIEEHLQKTQKKDNEDDKIDEILNKKSKEEIKKELKKVVNELNKIMSPLNADLKFNFNDKVDELIVKVVDTKNDKIIREFPPKEALKLMEKMRELVGLLFDQKG